MYEKEIKKILSDIKKKRVALGYSQEYMAIKLGISQNIYSKIEMDKIKLTIYRLLILCEILEMDPVELINFKNTNKIVALY